MDQIPLSVKPSALALAHSRNSVHGGSHYRSPGAVGKLIAIGSAKTPSTCPVVDGLWGHRVDKCEGM